MASSSYCPSHFSPLGSTRDGFVAILPYHALPASPWKLHNILEGLSVECLQQSFEVSGKLCLSSPCISSSSSVQISGGTCHRSILTIDSGNIMLDGGSLASSALSCHKGSHHGCFSRPGTQGSAISHLTLWLFRDMCCADMVLSSVFQAVAG